MAGARDAFHSIYTYILLFGIGLGSSVLLARLLGPEVKGIINYFQVVIELAVPILSFGVFEGIRYYMLKEGYTLNNAYSIVLLMVVTIGVFIASILTLLFVFNSLGQALLNISPTIFALFLCSALVELFILANIQLLIATNNFIIVNKLAIIKGTVFLLLIVGFYYFFQLTLTEAVIALLATKIIFIGALFWLSPDLIPRRVNKIDWNYLKKSTIFGSQVWLGGIANRANARLDAFFIGYMMPSSVIGVYNVSYQYLQLMVQPINSLFPIFYNRVVQGDRNESIQMLGSFHRILFYPTAVVGFLLVLFSQFVIEFMYGIEFVISRDIIFLLYVAFLFFGITRRTIQKYLTARGYPIASSIIQASGAITGLLCYIMFIPMYGMKGAAFGTCVAFLFSTFVGMILLWKRENYNPVQLFLIKKADFHLLIKILKQFNIYKSKE